MWGQRPLFFPFGAFDCAGWHNGIFTIAVVIDISRVSTEGASSTRSSIHATDKEDLLDRAERVVAKCLIQPRHLGVMQGRNIACPREYFLV
jgi:hypothetical protein